MGTVRARHINNMTRHWIHAGDVDEPAMRSEAGCRRDMLDDYRRARIKSVLIKSRDCLRASLDVTGACSFEGPLDTCRYPKGDN